MEDKKYYWLKLKRDFFKRHDIRIVEDMPNGKDYILFYLKMLVESVDHEGQLRFSDTIPYNEQMLATITNTNLDVVRAAIKIFTQLQMMEIADDGTIYMSEVLKMIGSAADNDNARRQQRYRDRKKEENKALPENSVTKNNADVTDSVTKDNESKRIEKEIEIDKELEIRERENKERNTHSHFVPPTVEEVYLYCEERHNGIDPQRFVDYYSARGWKYITDWKAQIRVWESRIDIE